MKPTVDEEAPCPCLPPSAASKRFALDFPGGPVVKNLPVKAGDTGLTSGHRRFHMPQSTKAGAP